VNAGLLCVVSTDILDRVKQVESPLFRPTVPSYKELLFSPEYYELMDRCWSEKPTDRPDFTHVVSVLRTFSTLRSRFTILHSSSHVQVSRGTTHRAVSTLLDTVSAFAAR